MELVRNEKARNEGDKQGKDQGVLRIVVWSITTEKDSLIRLYWVKSPMQPFHFTLVRQGWFSFK